MDRCNKRADVTILYSNTSQSTSHSWFISSSTLVHTKNEKSLTPILSGIAKFVEIGIGVERQQVLEFHTPTLVKMLRIVCLSLLAHLCLQNMLYPTPLLTEDRHPYLQRIAKFGGYRDRRRMIAHVLTPTLVKVLGIVCFFHLPLLLPQKMFDNFH